MSSLENFQNAVLGDGEADKYKKHPAERNLKTTHGGDVILFGDFRLTPSTRVLTREGSPVRLGARALDILIALIERAGLVVSKAELLAIVWPNTFIDESNLRVNIAALRKALADRKSGTRFIGCVPGRGYTFVAEVERISSGRNVVVFPRSAVANDRDHVPVPLVRIFGRDEIVGDIASQLPRKRLVTITGTGGVGKTAVALAVAQKLASTFQEGIQLVDLAPLASPVLVAAHLASLLRLPAPDTQPLPYAIAHLRPRNMLIVFDNCEHVIEAVGEITEAILQGAPGAYILATSREPLRATGEWVQRLEPLPVPPASTRLTAAEALRFPAVQLLAERSRACDVSWEMTDADAPVVAEICTRLDGLPLAIELAATRVLVFGLRGLADRLNDRFSILTKGPRTALPRHQTLEAMIEWSYETLSDDEKTVWRRFAVFRGVFTIDAADAIGNDRRAENFNIVDILDSLVDKSLVTVDSRGGEARYRLLESLRLYALNKLLGNKEAECVKRRHAQYWYERSVGSVDNWSDTPTAEWLSNHSGGIADVRAALEWAFAPEGDAILGIRIAAASAPLWFKTLLLPELRRNLERAIELAPRFAEIDDTLVMRMHIALGNTIFHTLGSVREAGEALDRALAMAERLDDVSSQLQIIWTHWGLSCAHGDYAAMRPWLERVRRILLNFPELPVAPLYDRMAALSCHLWGEQETALRHAEQAQSTAMVRCTRQKGVFVYDHKTATSSHYSRILWISGRPDEASEVIRDTITHALTVDQSFAFGFFLVFAACPVSCWTGDLEAARRHLSILLDVQSGITFNVWQMAGRLYERVLDFLEEADHQLPAARDKLVRDTSLTPFQADCLSTFDWRLLCPQSLARAMGGSINWCTAEVLRAEGETLLDAGNADACPEAETLFLRSIDISRRQKALSWELRSATSLARLWHLVGRTTQARALLTEVYGRFTEGFTTRDLIEAKTLLDALH
jgi:predicted ATPase/DNA-binding winged helix-turn-helix (wHTH) protein